VAWRYSRDERGGVAAGKIHWRNTREQLSLVGPRSLGVALLTASFVGMVFTIQVETAYAASGVGGTVLGGMLPTAPAATCTQMFIQMHSASIATCVQIRAVCQLSLAVAGGCEPS
jgi:hypothetical protein